MRARDVYGRGRVPLPTPAEAAELDRAAREEGGIPERVLMESAGRAAAQLVHALHPEGRIVATVGSGHNGGDAIVALRTLRVWGREVALIRAGERLPDPFPDHGHGLDEIHRDDAAEAYAHAAVLVDGILGTGGSGAPREPAASLIRAMNATGRPIVALDLPSGVDATTGKVPGDAVRAAVTVCFGWPKVGLLLHPAREHCGRLISVEIGFPPPAATAFGSELITPDWAAERLPRRSPRGHKGTSGKLLVVAGRPGFAGAAGIAVEAAFRAGAGLVRLASSAENREILQTLVPEAIFRDREEEDALDASSVDAVLLGPGVGIKEDGRRVMERTLRSCDGCPIVLDADALTLLGEEPDRLPDVVSGRPCVLTPHRVEMSRMTGIDVDAIRGSRIEVAREFAESIGCVVLLKGQPSIVAAPGEPVLVNTAGSSDVAKAGMGDQLAGTIAAMLAAGASAREAAAVGLFFASRAADLAGRGRALTPRDVSSRLHRAFADPGRVRPPFRLPFITFDQPTRW